MSVKGPDTRVNQDLTLIFIPNNDPDAQRPGLPLCEQEGPASREAPQSRQMVRTEAGGGWGTQNKAARLSQHPRWTTEARTLECPAGSVRERDVLTHEHFKLLLQLLVSPQRLTMKYLRHTEH